MKILEQFLRIWVHRGLLASNAVYEAIFHESVHYNIRMRDSCWYGADYLKRFLVTLMIYVSPRTLPQQF